MLETMHISERISQVWNELTRQNSRSQLTVARHPAPGSIRVHYGWYVSREFWQSLRPEDQHLTRMIAIHRAAKSQLVFSHLSAAVLLGIPVHADLRKAAHITTGSKGSCRPSKGLIRHARPLTALETVNVHGLRCTSPERTLLDLCAAETPETALSFADSYMRANFRVGRAVDEEQLHIWRDHIAHSLTLARGMRGTRIATQLLTLADPRKDSVLESISHLQLHRLGFEVELQVPVAGPHGRTYYADFKFRGLPLFGECDGKVKYTNPALLQGRSAGEQVYRDKRRDDWLQGSTDNKVIHWGYPEGANPLAMTQRLQAFNVPIPQPPW